MGTAQVAAATGYAGGEFHFAGVGAANWPTDPGTRDDHFALFTTPFMDFALAFSLSYLQTKGMKPRPEN
jgi:hypothetical protein